MPGVADLRFHLHGGVDGEWQGTFFFHSDDELSIARVGSDGATILETTLEAERRMLQVTITSFPDAGQAVFRTDQWSASMERGLTASSNAATPDAVERGARTHSRRRKAFRA